MSGGYNNNY